MREPPRVVRVQQQHAGVARQARRIETAQPVGLRRRAAVAFDAMRAAAHHHHPAGLRAAQARHVEIQRFTVGAALCIVAIGMDIGPGGARRLQEFGAGLRIGFGERIGRVHIGS
ncbi:Uncharacterised protein [Bordetella pertussis]|nr:Uncharacterised protein [Bordetella pertussis]